MWPCPELYYTWKNKIQSGPEYHLTAGRKILDLSSVDRDFHLGLVQPLFTQDFLKYEHQGLTGFHAEFIDKNYDVSLSVLPLYFPSQGPSVREENGEIITSNRWVRKPPRGICYQW